MGDEEPAAEPAAAEPEVVVSPRPVPAEEGAVTAAEIGAWCGMSSAAERMASVARRLGSTAHDEDVLREAGVADFSGYAVDPSQSPLPDLFLD